jgi:predicted nucleic acid-binding Zn ribbon protein
MPTYNFRNTETGEEFEVDMRISELDQYKQDNPTHQQFLTGAPRVNFRGVGTKSVTDSGFKEVLQKIHERTPGSQLDKSSTQL